MLHIMGNAGFISSTVFLMLVVWVSERVSQGFRAFRALGFEAPLYLSPPEELVPKP